uniref:Dual specificity protein phosphatase n=1 Tax=Paramormyrops kingsleyae TaxID=1676925 RepID=A0A3B3SJ96_9TELE
MSDSGVHRRRVPFPHVKGGKGCCHLPEIPNETAIKIYKPQEPSTARDKATLSGLGITHIVNGADGRIRSPVSLYNDMAITCYGVQAADHPSFDLSPFFYPTAAFIQTALSQKGKILQVLRDFVYKCHSEAFVMSHLQQNVLLQ